MNKNLSQPPKSPDQSAPTPFDAWQPPKAALEDGAAPRHEKPETKNSAAPLRAALFAPAVVIGPIACLFMIGGQGLAVRAGGGGNYRHLLAQPARLRFFSPRPG